ncbi:hypothetical protein KIL84_001716 [Mauremys mutica]|uniref:P-type domain-containing protein n=1 Tax=Mauremys mutica TaxID=74926 RepID=A0A9D3XJF3_9SAUR|nr:hypothetical protein KIL84_001716 [Mauremys mutica]
MKTGSDPRPPLPLLCLLLVLSVGGAGATGIGSFFRPLTCAQHLSLRRPCGGNPESFYASQCLKRKCCHDNGTCYHRAIDGEPKSRSDAEVADYLTKLLEESDQEEEKGMEPREEEPKEGGE